MKTKQIILALIAVLFSTTLVAQNAAFTYSYDDSGNRIKRELAATMALMAAVDSSEMEEALSLDNMAELLPIDTNNATIDAFKVQIYPNPSNGVYTVELPELQAGEKGILQVYGLMGQLVQEHRNLHTVQSVNISGALPGYYLLRIVIGDKIVQKTLIKQ